ncbi:MULTISPECIES: HD domain-containing protein [unclassified Massilia]|uniref:HD domain-containing protein n=1 Tax=unclassified Massilia TaxID=2609279 RepID=UPI001782385C|nr:MULTISPECIES: HD domain-containing protein [unclassified Massilia]MBD8532336.1 HD domain-containing protein [Massilia sp. CFBP 13647]MBD8673791.1 HD domain-containing protein [Massilia sp. CFBP 13721]
MHLSSPELASWRVRLAALAAAAGNDSDGAHDASHLERVWRSAQALLAHHPEADALVVLAACYLHDLVNLPKNDPDRAQASTRSARLACERLTQLGFPPERLDAVAHAIAAHSFSAAIAATTIEAKIVQDADRLDALGAVGLARMFYVAGSMGRALAHPSDPLADARPFDDRAWTLDHVMVKLARLPDMMQTEAGRALANERLERLLAFRREFAAEWLGEFPEADA